MQTLSAVARPQTSAVPPVVAGSLAGRPAPKDDGLVNLLPACGHVDVYGRGGKVYSQGEAAGTLYQVIFGAVRLYRLLADGRRQISAFYLPGEIFGFEADDSHQFFAEAICVSGLRIIRQSNEPAFTRALLTVALKSLAKAQAHLLVLGRQTATERVAAFLMDIAARTGGRRCFDLPMQRADIGDYLGLTIETVSRVFSRMKEDRLIRLPNSRSVEFIEDALLLEMSGGGWQRDD